MIISVATGLALPAYSGAVARYRLQSATHQLNADIDRATEFARATMTPVTVRFDPSTHVVTFDSLPGRRDPATDHVLDLRAHPNGATIVSASFSGLQQYTISAFGVPDSGGTVVLSGAGATRTVSVDATTGAVGVTP